MPSYTCTTCGREFSRRSSLRNHVKVHNNAAVDRVLHEITEEVAQAHEQQEGEEELNYDEQPEEEEVKDSAFLNVI